MAGGLDGSMDPESFATAYAEASPGYTQYDNGGYSNEPIELALSTHAEAAPPPATDWNEVIRNLGAVQPLALSGAYLLEAQDKKHRMGDLLAGCFEEYKKKRPGDPTGANFYQWLDAMPDFERVVMVSNADRAGAASATVMRGKPSGNVKPSMVKAFMTGVAYLDKAGRKSYLVTFKAGVAYSIDGDTETELDTAQMSTVFSGKGFGIWVMSKKGKLYVGNHVKGMLHHSSFLAGAEVICGGEMMARGGKILFLSGKSGHYQPRRENVNCALNLFEVSVNNFDDIKVAAWKDGIESPVYLVAPRTFLFSSSWQTWGKFSRDEMTRLRAGNFAGFPDS